MLKVTSFLENEYYVQLPEILCTSWELDADSELYASISDGKLWITKTKQRKSAVIIPLTVDMGIIIPEYLVQVLNFQTGYQITLTLNEDIVIISGNSKINLSLAAELETKLARELEIAQSGVLGRLYWMYLEDVYNLLTHSKLDDEVIEGLLIKPNPLIEIIYKIREDDELNDYIDNRILEKAREYAFED